jgi:hypothetical protein
LRRFKLVSVCLVCLVAVVAGGMAIGSGPTAARWGDEGLRSMRAVGLICLASAVAGMIPLAAVAVRWPMHIGQAALAGTGLRLFLTILLGAAYQTLARPHLASFLFWAVAFYCALLVVETVFGVLVVRAFFRAPGGLEGKTA